MPTALTTALESTAPAAGGNPSCELMANPLSSASLRYLVHQVAVADQPGPAATRPFGLRAAIPLADPIRPVFRYSHEHQVAIDSDGRPLIETMAKDWKTKASTDGDEGPEEAWGWEES